MTENLSTEKSATITTTTNTDNDTKEHQRTTSIQTPIIRSRVSKSASVHQQSKQNVASKQNVRSKQNLPVSSSSKEQSLKMLKDASKETFSIDRKEMEFKDVIVTEMEGREVGAEIKRPSFMAIDDDGEGEDEDLGEGQGEDEEEGDGEGEGEGEGFGEGEFGEDEGEDKAEGRLVGEAQEKETVTDEEEEHETGTSTSEEASEIESDEPKKISYREMLDAPRELPEPIPLTVEYLKNIEKELGLIKLCWPKIDRPFFENRTQFPQSYIENNNKERLLLLCTENFRRQFCYKYPHRKQIFLAAENECGMQKMVCTTIRSTKLAHPEIANWKDCAKFVSNQIRYEALEVPTLIPNRLCSPHTVFLRQSGQSFELATALCSLLLGLGYDAYVVSGYATRDITLRIMIRFEPPYPPDEEEIEEQEEAPPAKKYSLKPPRDLRSKFLLMMQQREEDKIKEKELSKIREEQEAIAEEEKPPPDDLEGARIHAWILIRPSRDVQTNIFVEPSAGHEHPVDSPLYCGIECIWNNINYWVNMQDCENGLGELDYDLSNLQKWEHLLLGEPGTTRKSSMTMDMEDEERELIAIMEEKHLDMPPPWSSKISIPHHVLKAKFPGGHSKTHYKRTIISEYAPYLQYDGLVRKIFRYEDFDCTELLKYEEFYENRIDKLIKRVYDQKNNSTTEYFDKGRDDCVIKHYFSGGHKIIDFDAKYRSDCLQKIEIHNYNMMEYYKGREDFLKERGSYYMEKEMPVDQKPQPSTKQPVTIEIKKQIFKIVECFDRNENIDANQDVAVCEFRLSDREIHLKYHYGKNKVTASTRVFIKPSVTDVTKEMNFTPDMTYGYQAELGAKPPGQFQLLQQLHDLIKAEEISLMRIRQMEDQITEFLELRLQETASPKLEISIFNREQNEEYRIGMLEKEKEILEHKEKEVEEDIDYLAPYLAWIGNPTYLTEKDAQQVQQECLQDFRQLLIDRANILQKQFEKTSDYLQEKYNWFSENQDQLSPEEEMDYFKEVGELNFKLHLLELRLHRHKELSAQRYAAMAMYLENHPRLRPDNYTDKG